MKKLDESYIKEELAKENYVLVGSYRNNRTIMNLICSKNHTYEVKYTDFQQGYRCKRCYLDTKPFDESFVRECLEKEGYELLSEYKNVKTDILVKCAKSHIDQIKYKLFSAGHRCKKCSSLKKTLDESFVRNLFETEGYLLLGKYENNYKNLDVKCPKGHTYEVTYSNFSQGHRCSVCSMCGTSKLEIQIFDIIKEKFPSVKKLRHRKINIPGKPHIRGFDVDIFIPELNLGIEFDGQYYHSFEYMRNTPHKKGWSDEDILNYHQIKDDYFLTKGVKILHIKEEDWILDKQECVNRCFKFLTNS